MKKKLLAAFAVMLLLSCDNQAPEITAEPVASDSTVIKAAEIGDAKTIEIGKRFLSLFSKGDIDGWVNDLADSAVFVWNNGDSLKGRTVIADYWKERWNGLASITFSNDIWLPLHVNQPQSVEAPGDWLLGWYMFDEKFKNGKGVVEWAHDDMHLDENGKVDRMIHYVDMAPIKAAAGK